MTLVTRSSVMLKPGTRRRRAAPTSASLMLPAPIPIATARGAPASRFTLNAPRKTPGATRLPSRSNRRERDTRRRPDNRRETRHRIERQTESGRDDIERGQPEIERDLAQTFGHEPNPAGSFTRQLCDYVLWSLERTLGQKRAPWHETASRDLSGRLEQLDRIAVGIFQLDLLAARADLHLVAKVEPGPFQGPLRMSLRPSTESWAKAGNLC